MSAVIFNGQFVKTLKDQLKLSDTARILTGTDDPTSVAKDAEQGSVYLRTGGSGGSIYTKQDSGSSTNWNLIGSATSGIGGTTLDNLGLFSQVGGNALTVNLKQSDGSSDPSVGAPVTISFRDASTNGKFNARQVTSALSMTVSSGSTLGHSSGNAHPVYVYALDNAGTVELAVSTALFDENDVVSTTAEGGAGAADSNAVMYSTTARTSVPIRMIGMIISTQTTAGLWGTGVTTYVGSFQPLKPFLRVVQTSGQTITRNTATTVVYDTIVKDTANCFNTSTGVFTANEKRRFCVTACAEMNAPAVLTSLLFVTDGSNNVLAYGTLCGSISSINSGTTIVSASVNLDLNAGDQVKIRMWFDDGTANRALTGNPGANVLTIAAW